jgi:hypothetical protein
MTNEDTRAKLADFLAQALASQGEYLVDKIVLMHTPRGTNNRDYLRTWKRSNEIDRPMFESSKAAIDKLTRTVVALAENQLETLGGSARQPSRFKITISQIDGTPTVYPFTIALESDGESDVDGTGDGDGVDKAEIAPTRDSLVLETMRQNRELHQRNSDTTDKVFNWMAKSVVQLTDQNDRLLAALAKRDAEREQWLARVEEANGKKHEREIEAGLVAAEVERKDLITKKALGLLPVLTSRLLESSSGGSDKPTDADKQKPMSELTIVLGEWGSSLTSEQQGKIAGTLAPEQQIMLFEIKRLVGRGGGAVLAQVAHGLFSSLHKKQLEILFGAITEEQGQTLVRAMKLAEAETTAAQPDEGPKKSTAPEAQEATA